MSISLYQCFFFSYSGFWRALSSEVQLVQPCLLIFVQTNSVIIDLFLPGVTPSSLRIQGPWFFHLFSDDMSSVFSILIKSVFLAVVLLPKSGPPQYGWEMPVAPSLGSWHPRREFIYYLVRHSCLRVLKSFWCSGQRAWGVIFSLLGYSLNPKPYTSPPSQSTEPILGSGYSTLSACQAETSTMRTPAALTVFL